MLDSFRENLCVCVCVCVCERERERERMRETAGSRMEQPTVRNRQKNSQCISTTYNRQKNLSIFYSRFTRIRFVYYITRFVSNKIKHQCVCVCVFYHICCVHCLKFHATKRTLDQTNLHYLASHSTCILFLKIQ